MKNIDQRLNKKHLSFIAACLCSTVFFNDSPSWGMNAEDLHPRPEGLLAHQPPLQRRRLEEAYDYSLKNHATPVATLRAVFKSFTEEFKNSQVTSEQMGNTCNKILDDNPLMLRTACHPIDGEPYPIPDSTKEKLQGEITELLGAQSRTIKKYEKLARDPIARFDEMTRTLSFRGKIIGTSDIDQILKNNVDKGTQPNTINISASHTFLIDDDLKCPGLMFNVQTSLFKIGNNKIIDLTGLNGTDGGQDHDGIVGSTVGNPGEKGGTFIAKASKIDDLHRLSIKVDGGRGGNGGNGVLGNPPDAKYYLGKDYDMDYIKSKRTDPRRMNSIMFTETVYSESGKLQWYEAKGEAGTTDTNGRNASSGGIGGEGGTASIEINGAQILHINGAQGEKGKDGRSQKGIWKSERKTSELMLTAPGCPEICIGSTPLSPEWEVLYYEEESRAADGQKGVVNEPAPLPQPQDIDIPMEEDNAQQQPDLDDVVEQ